MKLKRIVSCLLIMLMIPVSLCLVSCEEEGNPVKVTIIDCGKKTKVEGHDNMTVKGLLDKAGVAVDGRDKVMPKLDTRWKDVGGDSITVRRYAKVTVTDGTESKEVEMIGGTVELAINQAGFHSASYSADADKSAYLLDGMTITLEKATEGFVEENGKTYYYSGGEPVKDGIAGSDEDGYFYANSEGVIDKGYCDGVTVNGDKWIVINGEAKKVDGESDEVLYLAAQMVAKCTDSSMSKDEKIRASFDYMIETYLEGVRHDPPYYEMDWPILYANDIFVYGKGDCYSYGAAFAYVGKALGCEAIACNSGGHGWAEVDGLVYDPEWTMHSEREMCAIDYDDDTTDVKYKKAMEQMADWKKITIEW